MKTKAPNNAQNTYKEQTTAEAGEPRQARL